MKSRDCLRENDMPSDCGREGGGRLGVVLMGF